MYALHVGVENWFREQKFPRIPHVYGPEAFQRRPDHTTIICERDESDEFAPPRGHSRNGPTGQGRKLGTRKQGVVFWVIAKDSRPGARRQDHEDVADQIADALQCALYDWGTSNSQPVEIEGGGFVPDSLLPKVYEKWPGVVYMLRVKVERGVYHSDYEGKGLSEVLLEKVRTTSEISTPGGTPAEGPTDET